MVGNPICDACDCCSLHSVVAPAFTFICTTHAQIHMQSCLFRAVVIVLPAGCFVCYFQQNWHPVSAVSCYSSVRHKGFSQLIVIPLKSLVIRDLHHN